MQCELGSAEPAQPGCVTTHAAQQQAASSELQLRIFFDQCCQLCPLDRMRLWGLPFFGDLLNSIDLGDSGASRNG